MHCACRNKGRVWKGGCGQPSPATRPLPARTWWQRATHICLAQWSNLAWASLGVVWVAPGSRAGSPTTTNCQFGVVFVAEPGWATTLVLTQQHIAIAMNKYNQTITQCLYMKSMMINTIPQVLVDRFSQCLYIKSMMTSTIAQCLYMK